MWLMRMSSGVRGHETQGEGRLTGCTATFQATRTFCRYGRDGCRHASQTEACHIV